MAKFRRNRFSYSNTPKYGQNWVFLPIFSFFPFLNSIFLNLEPKTWFFIHQMWDEISQMTNICHKCTQNETFKFDQKRNCPLSNARWGLGGSKSLDLNIATVERYGDSHLVAKSPFSKKATVYLATVTISTVANYTLPFKNQISNVKCPGEEAGSHFC